MHSGATMWAVIRAWNARKKEKKALIFFLGLTQPLAPVVGARCDRCALLNYCVYVCMRSENQKGRFWSVPFQFINTRWDVQTKMSHKNQFKS